MTYHDIAQEIAAKLGYAIQSDPPEGDLPIGRYNMKTYLADDRQEENLAEFAALVTREADGRDIIAAIDPGYTGCFAVYALNNQTGVTQ